jgi:hypothetical protein
MPVRASQRRKRNANMKTSLLNQSICLTGVILLLSVSSLSAATHYVSLESTKPLEMPSMTLGNLLPNSGAPAQSSLAAPLSFKRTFVVSTGTIGGHDTHRWRFLRLLEHGNVRLCEL